MLSFFGKSERSSKKFVIFNENLAINSLFYTIFLIAILKTIC